MFVFSVKSDGLSFFCLTFLSFHWLLVFAKFFRGLFCEPFSLPIFTLELTGLDAEQIGLSG